MRVDGQPHAVGEPIGDQRAPGVAAGHDPVAALPGAALQGGAAALVVAGVLDEEPHDPQVERAFRGVGAATLSQLLDRRRPQPVEQRTALGVAAVGVGVEQVEELEARQPLRRGELAECGAVVIDVQVGHSDEVGEDVPVGADEHPRTRFVHGGDLGPDAVQVVQRQPLPRVGQPAEHLGRVRGLAGERR
ncbi:hypothetical protein Ae356Ps1_6312 [Pseudonocardia sp. Ae356_Ps1]|nr:hypothetical protein Ae356Ps1_6312 [Pseudonocardia sp. Ae356_Ps1]